MASREGFHVAAKRAGWPGKILGDPVRLTPAAYLLVVHVQEGSGHFRLVNLPDEERWLVRPLRLDPEKGQLPRDHGTDLGWAQARAGIPCGLVANGREGTLESPEAGDQLPGAAPFPWAVDLLALDQLCLMASTAPDPAPQLLEGLDQNTEPTCLGPKILIVDGLPNCL